MIRTKMRILLAISAHDYHAIFANSLLRIALPGYGSNPAENRFFLGSNANIELLTIIFGGNRLQITLSKVPMSNLTMGQQELTKVAEIG